MKNQKDQINNHQQTQSNKGGKNQTKEENQAKENAEEKLKNDLNQQIQRAIKKRGDTAVHCAVVENDPIALRDLLVRGLRVFNQSDADGATALHRAAEVGSIECAKILLEYNADIDALNFMGQTSFHVAAESQDFEFGKFLIKNRARKNCRSGCKKCRLFVKQIEKYDKNARERLELEKQQKLEEQKMQETEKLDQKLVEQMNQLDLMDEIKKVKEEMGGPFFNRKHNQLLRDQQERYRKEIEERDKVLKKGSGIEHYQSNFDMPIMYNDSPVEVEKIRPRRQVKQKIQPQPQMNQQDKIEAKEQIKSKILQRQEDKLPINDRPQTQQQTFQRNQTHQRQLAGGRSAFTMDCQQQHQFDSNASLNFQSTFEIEPPPLVFDHQNQGRMKHKKKRRMEEEEIKTTRSKDDEVKLKQRMEEVDSDIENFYN